MKLNLWMIANRLGQYEVESVITSTTERTISGPLPISTLQSIYIHKKGNDIVCDSEQGTIIIRGVTEDEGFLLIQSIFNWYDDWLDKIEVSIKEKDYRRYVHLCAQAFDNPVLLLDSNMILFGMDCRGLSFDEIPEWKNISEKGQITVPYYTMMAKAVADPVRRYANNVVRFSAEQKNMSDTFCGLHVSFSFRLSEYGTMTVLEKKRRLNPGDIALLEVLAEKSSVLFAATDRDDTLTSGMQIINSLLEFKPVSDEKIDFIQSMITVGSSAKNDFCLFLFHYEVDPNRAQLAELLRNVIAKSYPTAFQWIFRGDLLILTFSPDAKTLGSQMLSFVAFQGYADKLQMGVSLPFNELRDIPYFYEQAVFAVTRQNDSVLCDFYSVARYYLLETTDPQRRIMACEPHCLKAWRESPEERKNLETISAYLEYERASSLAAEALFIHKNTLSYRIRNMKNVYGWDLEDPSLRDYLRLSIFVLSHTGS